MMLFIASLLSKQIFVTRRIPAHMFLNTRSKAFLRMYLRHFKPDTYLLCTIYNQNELDIGISGKRQDIESVKRAVRREVIEEIGCNVINTDQLVQLDNHPHVLLTDITNLESISAWRMRQWDSNIWTRHDSHRKFTLCVTATRDTVERIRSLVRTQLSEHRPTCEDCLSSYCFIHIEHLLHMRCGDADGTEQRRLTQHWIREERNTQSSWRRE